jgi:hypothetical protein
VAQRIEICTSAALLPTASRAGSTGCAKGLQKIAALQRNGLIYLVFFSNDDFLVSS